MSTDFKGRRVREVKQDSRQSRYSWAPGEYLCTCFSCSEYFAGDKRAGLCADCAYALPDPEPFNAAEMEHTLTEQEYHVGFWESFGRAVAKEVGCLVSLADPRPEHGNAHVISAIRRLKAPEAHWQAIAASLSAGKAYAAYEPERDNPPCAICNTRHHDGSTCEVETLQNCLQAKQVELDGADKVIANLKGELETAQKFLASTQSELDLLRRELGCWTQFGRAVAKEVNCLVSYADPRPDHGNAHILKAIVALKNQLEAIKARNVINAIKEICHDCGHTLDENDECANCWKTACEGAHAEFAPIYSALACFLKDWKDGDFQLPRLAEIHAEKLHEELTRRAHAE